MTPNDFFEQFTRARAEPRFERNVLGVSHVSLGHDPVTDIWIGELTTGVPPVTSLSHMTRHHATGTTIEAVAEQLERVMEHHVANPFVVAREKAEAAETPA